MLLLVLLARTMSRLLADAVVPEDVVIVVEDVDLLAVG